jgi:hypothetical protein
MLGEAFRDRLPPQRSRTLDELAAIQHVAPVDSLDELASNLWESDEELDAFIEDVQRSRHSTIA